MLYCDFCGRSQEEVKKMILSENNVEIAICNDCVIRCMGLLTNKLKSKNYKKLNDEKENKEGK